MYAFYNFDGLLEFLSGFLVGFYAMFQKRWKNFVHASSYIKCIIILHKIIKKLGDMQCYTGCNMLLNVKFFCTKAQVDLGGYSREYLTSNWLINFKHFRIASCTYSFSFPVCIDKHESWYGTI